MEDILKIQLRLIEIIIAFSIIAQPYNAVLVNNGILSSKAHLDMIGQVSKSCVFFLFSHLSTLQRLLV